MLAPLLIAPVAKVIWLFAATPMAVALCKTILPFAMAGVMLLLVKAPLLLMPVPFRLIALAIVLPLRSKTPPLFIVIAPVPTGPLVTVPLIGVELAPIIKVAPEFTVVPRV